MSYKSNKQIHSEYCEKFGTYNFEGTKEFLENMRKEDLQAVVDMIEGVKENMGNDLPTNDFCYSEYHMSRNYDKSLYKIQSLITSLIDGE